MISISSTHRESLGLAREKEGEKYTSTIPVHGHAYTLDLSGGGFGKMLGTPDANTIVDNSQHLELSYDPHFTTNKTISIKFKESGHYELVISNRTIQYRFGFDVM